MKKLLLLFIFLAPQIAASAQKNATTTKILESSGVIWGFDFLDQNKILFTKKDGELILFDRQSRKQKKLPAPKDIRDFGQGGLLDVYVYGPSVYVTYSEKTGFASTTTSLAMARWNGKDLSPFKKIFQANASTSSPYHFGSRLAIVENFLFMSVGDRGRRNKVQDLDNHHGKILRLNLDGSIPKGNPFKSAVWSLGHRNPQGLVFDKKRKILFNAEFGPRGGDEVNIVQKGKNYGWPVITYGREYSGGKIGVGTHKDGMEQPIVHWTPSISPSAIAVFKGDLFLASLGSEHIKQVILDENKVIGEKEYLTDLGERFRAIKVGPDGKLYASTDSGKILRIDF